MDRFQELLWDLGKIIDIPLYLDRNHTCRILLDEKLPIHLEMAEEEDDLLVAALVSEIPPGHFRENVLKEALKVNATYHFFGTFAYFDKINTLVMHRYLSIDHLTGETLVEFLEGFISEANNWKEAIANGHVAPSEYLTTHSSQPSPYSIPPKIS